ncbi:MAG: family 1 encapsulin nanocompartment shell protein [Sporichthyaceae bacterium]
MTDHLLRAFAPVADKAWELVDSEATSRLTNRLVARRLVDWSGPHGWEYSATSLGRARTVDPSMTKDARVRVRELLPVVELRVPFTVARAELDDAARGARDLEFADLDRAASQVAEWENTAILHGWPAAGIEGVGAASSHDPIPLGLSELEYPHKVALGVNALRQAGIEGPFALVVGPDAYRRVVETTEPGGRPLLDHLRQVLDGDVLPAFGVEGAILLSRRGGDFVFDVGQDLSVGYVAHDAETVTLYLEESFTFRVVEPDAGIALD